MSNNLKRNSYFYQDLLEEVIIDMHYLWGVSLKTWTPFFVVKLIYNSFLKIIL